MSRIQIYVVASFLGVTLHAIVNQLPQTPLLGWLPSWRAYGASVLVNLLLLAGWFIGTYVPNAR
jgi:hypothetical protein